MLRHCGCFRAVATVNNTAMNVGVQISLQDSVSFPLDTDSKVGLRGPILLLF